VTTVGADFGSVGAHSASVAFAGGALRDVCVWVPAAAGARPYYPMAIVSATTDTRGPVGRVFGADGRMGWGTKYRWGGDWVWCRP